MEKIGRFAKDRISGFEGIVVGKTIFLFGCANYGLAPTRLKPDGTPLDIYWVDAPRVQVIGEGVPPEDMQDMSDGDDVLGKLAKDKISGLEAIIVGVRFDLFDCASYGLAPRALGSDGKPFSSWWFDEGRIEILGEGIPPETVKASRPGGDDLPGPHNMIR